MPYEFSLQVSMDAELKGLVYSAMEEWEQKTCITFEPFSISVGIKVGHFQRILIREDKEGCNSVIGKAGELWMKPQEVSAVLFNCSFVSENKPGQAIGCVQVVLLTDIRTYGRT